MQEPKTEELGPCKLWTGAKNSRGYGHTGRDGRTVAVHRLAWEEANGPIPPGAQVLHKCDVPACYELRHLFLGTAADNQADMTAKGRGRIGLRNGRSKMNPDRVLELRRRRAAGDTLQAIASDFGVSIQAVWRVDKRKSWKHV